VVEPTRLNPLLKQQAAGLDAKINDLQRLYMQAMNQTDKQNALAQLKIL